MLIIIQRFSLAIQIQHSTIKAHNLASAKVRIKSELNTIFTIFSREKQEFS